MDLTDLIRTQIQYDVSYCSWEFENFDEEIKKSGKNCSSLYHYIVYKRFKKVIHDFIHGKSLKIIEICFDAEQSQENDYIDINYRVEQIKYRWLIEDCKEMIDDLELCIEKN